MNNSSSHQSEMGSKQRLEPTFSVFDLTKLGLSATLAIGVFIVIGHLVRHVAGPAVILSVTIAAVIAFLAGTFYVELNRTILLSDTSPSSSPTSANGSAVSPPVIQKNAHNDVTIPTDLLMPSYLFTYICNTEFSAFIIGWNLISEYVIGVALVSKAIVSSFDALVFGSSDFSLVQIIPMSWNLSDNFDLFAFLVPILIGGPLVLLLKQNTIINGVSVCFSLAIVAIFLILGTVKADFANWNSTPSQLTDPNAVDNGAYGAGGFFPFGIDGMFKGVAIVLFIFIAFDAMVMSTVRCCSTKRQTRRIGNFSKTINISVLSINGILFTCLFGMAVALTSIQPYYSLADELTVPMAANIIGWSGMKFIIMSMGIVSLLGSLYALMHAILRTIQVMAFYGPGFKWVGNFANNNLQREIRKQLKQQQQQQQPQQHTQQEQEQRQQGEVDDKPSSSHSPHQHEQRRQRQAILGGLLLFSLLGGLLAGLFAVKHLINLLSFGTLLMLFALTVDIIILRYSINLKETLHQPNESNVENSTATLRSKRRSISLITILLSIFCILSIILVVFLKLLQCEIIRLQMGWIVTIVVLLVIPMLSIIFVMGLQPKRNSIFELKLAVNPLFPAVIIFACIYLLAIIDVTAWMRFLIWTLIGSFLYLQLIYRKKRLQNKQTPIYGIKNRAFISELDENRPTEVKNLKKTTVSSEPLKLEDRPITPDIIRKKPEIAKEMHTIQATSERPLGAIATVYIDAVNTALVSDETLYFEIKKKMSDRKSSISQIQNGFDEIESAEKLKHVCVERREPNGTAYFIEMDTIENISDSSSETLSDDKPFDLNGIIERDMLERVLNPFETVRKHSYEANRLPELKVISGEPFPATDESETEDENKEENYDDDEKEVVAIIHSSNDELNGNESQKVISENSVSVLETTSFVSTPDKETNEIASSADRSVLPTQNQNFFSIGVYKSEASRLQPTIECDGQRAEFKQRLERLLGGSDASISKTIGRSGLRFTEQRERNDQNDQRLPLYHHSNSAPDSLNLAFTTYEEQHGQKVQDNDDEKNSKIPSAPVFNQHLYDTIGRHVNVQKPESETISTTALNTKNEFDKPYEGNAAELQAIPKKVNLRRSRRNEDLSKLFHRNDNHVDAEIPAPSTTSSIKERLEEIFSRGIIVTPILDKAHNNGDNDNRADHNDDWESDNEQIIHYRKPFEPFDTVRKQKMLFSDVLKSIGPNVRTSLHRTSSTASSDIEIFRNRNSID